jgi:hypothetical protein
MPIDPVLTVLTVLTVMRHWKTERNWATNGNVSVIALWMITPIEDETGTTSDAVALSLGRRRDGMEDGKGFRRVRCGKGQAT